MSFVSYGIRRTRITLYEGDGIPKYRVTLQKEVREGLTLEFKPEGISHPLGSGAAWATSWVHRGWRPSLQIKWDVGLESTVESWFGGAWYAPETILTSGALSLIHTMGMQTPCMVEPHLDAPISFMARPDPGKLFSLLDRKGVAHVDLRLSLVGVALIPSIPVETGVDASGEIGASWIFTRPSTAYGFDGTLLGLNEPARESMIFSPAAFSDLPNYPSPFENTDTPWDYDTTISRCKQLAAWNPGTVVYEDMSRVAGAELLASGREQAALKILDDGARPVIVLHSAIHANERHSIRGIHHVVQQVLTSNDPLLKWVRENMAIHWLVAPNPDGIYWDKRGLGNWADVSTDRNGNREYPYFWDRAIDPGKGPTPLADAEIRNVVHWMGNKISRALIVCDVHQWFTQTIYGWLTDHVWRSPASQALNASIFHYTNTLMGQRDYTGVTITSPAGSANMHLSYRSKAFKPYFEEWCAVRMREDGTAFQVEQPQAENQSLNATMTIDLCTAIFQGAQDALLGVRTGVHVAPGCDPTDVLSTNGTLSAWHATEPRPQYMSLAGLDAQQDVTVGSGPGQIETNLFRPGSAAWPEEVAYAAGCRVDTGDPATSFIAVVGGRRTPGPSTSTHGHIEYLQPPPPPAPGSSASSVYTPVVLQKRIPDLPVVTENHALASDGTHLYCVCGYDSVNGYHNTIYRIPVTGILTGAWELWHTLTTYTGLQRHTAHIHGGKIFIVGGRDAVAYKNTILSVDLATKAEAIFCTLATLGHSTGFGWHSSVLVGDELYILGGWGGSAARDAASRVNLTTVSQSTLNTIPFARRQAHASYRPDNGGEIWLMAGRGTTDYSETLYRYRIADGTWAGFLAGSGYSIEIPDSESNEDGETLARPTFFRAAGCGFWNPVTQTFLVMGGEDETGTVKSSVWEFDPEAMAAHQRSTQDMLWGYIGPSTSPVVDPGGQLSFVTVLRNDHQPDDLTIQPVVRPVIYVDPYGSPRKLFHKYVVPPRSPMALAMHVDVEIRNYSTAQQVRPRLRLYGGGTKIKVRWIQATRVPFLALPVDPVLGRAEGSYSAELTQPISADSERWCSVALMPRWGSQMAGDFAVISATTSGELNMCEIGWVSQPTIAPGAWTPEEAATGAFMLRYRLTGDEGYTEINLTPGLKLNHDRFTSFHKREQIYLRFAGEAGGIRVSAWHYGKTWSAVVPTLTGALSALHVSGTGTSVAGGGRP